MEGKSVGEGDVEDLQKAKRRGRAYMCLHCFHKRGRRVVDVRGRIEDIILREHRTYEEVPYYCSLCYFRCLKREQLVNHITAYRRHVNIAVKAGITDHSQYLKQNSSPKMITSMDYYMFSVEESIDHFFQVSKAAEASKLELKDSVLQCLPPSVFNIETASNDIPEYVPTPILNTPTTTVPSTDITSTVVKCADPFYQDQPVVAYPMSEGLDFNYKLSIPEDSRVVAVTNSCDSSSNNCMVNSDNSVLNLDNGIAEADKVETEQGSDKEEEIENENILDQLLPEDEVMELNNTIPQDKRKTEGEGEEGVKRQRGFSVQDIGEKTLISAISELAGEMDRNVKAMDRLEKLLVDNTCVMAKLADSITRFKWTIEEREKLEEEREEKREEEDRRREEERRTGGGGEMTGEVEESDDEAMTMTRRMGRK